MTNTALRTLTVRDTADMVRNRFEEHIQEKVEKIQEQKAVTKGRLGRMIRFLFSSESANPYGLRPDMQAKMFL